jgi:hypothetical protein
LMAADEGGFGISRWLKAWLMVGVGARPIVRGSIGWTRDLRKKSRGPLTAWVVMVLVNRAWNQTAFFSGTCLDEGHEHTETLEAIA